MLLIPPEVLLPGVSPRCLGGESQGLDITPQDLTTPLPFRLREGLSGNPGFLIKPTDQFYYQFEEQPMIQTAFEASLGKILLQRKSKPR